MLLIVAVGVAGNMHLPLVQAVAWARMYSQYRQVYNSEVSLRLTFSGQYPCKLCKVVATAEKERGSLSGIAVSSIRLLLPFPPAPILVTEPTEISRQGWTETAAFVPGGFARPEVPPPRWA
jgi:hypothetical protein